MIEWLPRLASWRRSLVGVVVLVVLGVRGGPASARHLERVPHSTSGHIALPAALAQAAARVLHHPLSATSSTAFTQTELTAADGVPGDTLGYSVALSGKIAVIGAYGANNNTGAAYVFVQSGSTWTQQAKLTAADGVPGDETGASVAVSGNRSVIGAPYKNKGTGAAYVFVQSGSNWAQQAELTASDGASEAQCGFSVAVSGNTAVIGAPGRSNYTGAAYVYVAGGGTWTQQAELTASEGAAGDQFGYSVAVSGNIAVIGAPSFNHTGESYVYVHNSSTWMQRAKLVAADGGPVDYFGWSVAASGTTGTIGAPARNAFVGTAYMFWHP
jgi:hypothetical protein